MEPLYSGQPQQILDCLPALMNALKMIHTISRYFHTTQKMTRLFMKITNQVRSRRSKSLDHSPTYDI